MAVPPISGIPDANLLYQQMDAIDQAIAALQTGSCFVTSLTVSAPPAPIDDPTKFTLPINVLLNPPIGAPATIQQLIVALQFQSDSVCQQLINLGFEDDDEVRAAKLAQPVSTTESSQEPPPPPVVGPLGGPGTPMVTPHN